jgi:hypothetical protein
LIFKECTKLNSSGFTRFKSPNPVQLSFSINLRGKRKTSVAPLGLVLYP